MPEADAAKAGSAKEGAAKPGPQEAVDFLLPFSLTPPDASEDAAGPAFIGRIVRLGPLLEDILQRHDYPAPVAALLGEALALLTTLAGGLKFDGVLTFQVQGDGPVSLLVADVTSAGIVRGYAKYDADGLSEAAVNGAPRVLLGDGHLAVTVDQGPQTERYQGLVALTGDSLAACAQHYFRQSAQIDTAVMLAAGRLDGSWRGAGLMVQRMPNDARMALRSDDGDDPWRRVMMLMATGTRDELLGPELAAERYLYRLFHEENLRVQPTRALQRGCRCSSERIVAVLNALPRDELTDLEVDGHLIVTCEFCSEIYSIHPSELSTD